MELGPKLRGDASSLPIFFLERNKVLWATDRQALMAFLQLLWMQGFSRGSQHFCLIQRPQAPDKNAGWCQLQSMKAVKRHQALVEADCPGSVCWPRCKLFWALQWEKLVSQLQSSVWAEEWPGRAKTDDPIVINSIQAPKRQTSSSSLKRDMWRKQSLW